MSISIIIPCFNDAATLGAAIESALIQGGRVSEIIVVEDGSADDSLMVARQFDSSVRVVTGPNRGVSAARNRGIAESEGEWLVFLDADDLLLQETLARRLAMAEKTGADVVICDWRELVGEERCWSKGPIRAIDVGRLAADAEAACATGVWAPLAALMYRRDLVGRIGGFRLDLPVIQDARFLFDAARQGARFARSPHIGACYRMRPQSLSRRDPAGFWRDVMLNGTQIEALWRARGCLDAVQRTVLADIYNGAAHALFRARDPKFREALTALRASGLPIGRRNRVAEILSNVGGQHAAARLAELWTVSRRVLRIVRSSVPIRTGRAR